jgi:preprotein translocase subunit SecY
VFEYFFSYFKNIWKIEDLRYKIGITLGFLLVYRFSSYVPLPGINTQGISNFMENVNTGEKGLLQILYSFPGGAFNRASVLALGIMPYISSSIFVHLISLIFPYLQNLKKDGECGRMRINCIIRLVTVIICFIQATTYCTILTTKFIPFYYAPKAYLLDLSIYMEKVFFWVISIVVLTGGTFFTIWIGENITDKGIGNGVSLIIMSGIMDRFPNAISTEIVSRLGARGGLFFLFFECLLWLLVVCVSITVIQAVRKVPVQYVGSIQNKNQYIPLKVISVGVMPIIFAQSIMLFPMMISSNFRSFSETFNNVYGFWYNLVFSIFIIFFTFFYTAVTIPVNQIADDLKRDGGHIPKVKPGKETLDYLDNILAVITIPGSFLLVIIAILPSFIVKIGVTKNLALFYGGTSLFIIVVSILDTMQQIDPYFLNNYYDHLLNKKLWIGNT